MIRVIVNWFSPKMAEESQNDQMTCNYNKRFQKTVLKYMCCFIYIHEVVGLCTASYSVSNGLTCVKVVPRPQSMMGALIWPKL